MDASVGVDDAARRYAFRFGLLAVLSPGVWFSTRIACLGSVAMYEMMIGSVEKLPSPTRLMMSIGPWWPAVMAAFFVTGTIIAATRRAPETVLSRAFLITCIVEVVMLAIQQLALWMPAALLHSSLQH